MNREFKFSCLLDNRLLKGLQEAASTLQGLQNVCNVLYPTVLRYVVSKCCDHLAKALRNAND